MTTSSVSVESTLSNKVTRGIVWTLTNNTITRIIGLSRIFILARLLSPQDFGLFGIVMLTAGIIETLSATGFKTALIQRKGDVYSHLNTAWSLNIIRGLILASVIVAIAPLIGWFFEEPGVVILLQVYSITVAINGFVNVNIIFFVKNLEFHKQFLLKNVASVTSLIVGLILAIYTRSVWALIWAELARSVAQLILSYLLHPSRPRFSLDVKQAKELFQFGRWMFLSVNLSLLLKNLDDVVVGKFLGTAALGVYQLSYRMSKLAVSDVALAISEATLPAYSKLQDDRERVGQAFLRTLNLSTSLVAPVCFGIASVASIFVPVVLGAQWLEAIPIVQLLGVYGFSFSLKRIVSSLYIGLGYPRYFTITLSVETVLMILLLWPLTQMSGVVGTCLAIIIPSLLTRGIDVFLVKKLIGLSFGQLFKAVLIPTLVALVMAMSVYLITLTVDPHWFGLIICVMAGGLVYGAGLFILDRQTLFKIYGTLASTLNLSTKLRTGNLSRGTK